jgi:hypothetical protein
MSSYRFYPYSFQAVEAPGPEAAETPLVEVAQALLAGAREPLPELEPGPEMGYSPQDHPHKDPGHHRQNGFLRCLPRHSSTLASSLGPPRHKKPASMQK